MASAKDHIDQRALRVVGLDAAGWFRSSLDKRGARTKYTQKQRLTYSTPASGAVPLVSRKTVSSTSRPTAEMTDCWQQRSPSETSREAGAGRCCTHHPLAVVVLQADVANHHLRQRSFWSGSGLWKRQECRACISRARRCGSKLQAPGHDAIAAGPLDLETGHGDVHAAPDVEAANTQRHRIGVKTQASETPPRQAVAFTRGAAPTWRSTAWRCSCPACTPRRCCTAASRDGPRGRRCTGSRACACATRRPRRGW